MSEEITAERVQELVTRAPYHKWLGLKVVALHDDGGGEYIDASSQRQGETGDSDPLAKRSCHSCPALALRFRCSSA